MEIKNRLFPYPVLCGENDDYVDSTFIMEYKCTEEMSGLLLDFNIYLENNEELQWLIREGYAEYVIHIECSSTAFRTIKKTSGNQIRYRIPKAKVNNEIALLGMIVAVKEIPSFKSTHLNEDYVEETISFNRGAILAYCNMPKIYVVKNYEELAGDNAFFTIIKRINVDSMEQNPITYDISDPKIKILVDENIYNEYITYRTNANMEALNSALLIMPAIIYMVDVLRTEGTENYRSLYWYHKINKSCKLQGYDLEADLIENYEKTSVEIAQQMLQLPLNRAFESLACVLIRGVKNETILYETICCRLYESKYENALYPLL